MSTADQAERAASSIPNHKIVDFQSFRQVTGDNHEVAGIYFFSVLDCLVELANKVSHDFFMRPHLYLRLPSSDEGGSIAETVARLHARYGNDERFLGKFQRRKIYCALFGGTFDEDMSEQEGNFPRLRDELINACAAFAERVFDTGVEMLRERVRTTHRPFREYLVGLLGDSVRWSRSQALAPLTEGTAYPILRNRGVTAVFSISVVPCPEWPYVEDSNGDKVVEELSKQLLITPQQAREVEANAYRTSPITRGYFSNLQRAALRGAEAIATVIDFSEGGSNEDVDLLITKCYTWGAALISLAGGPAISGPGASVGGMELVPAQGAYANRGLLPTASVRQAAAAPSRVRGGIAMAQPMSTP